MKSLPKGEAMSEAWRAVARLGRSGEAYPHVLADSHGWCLRLGPRAQGDEKYYSSFATLLGGLTEHFLRRRLGKDVQLQNLLNLRNEVGCHLKHIASLGAELDWQLGEPAPQRPQEPSGSPHPALPSGDGSSTSKIAAGMAENGSEAA
jgi:hypothetical protein